MAPVSPKHAFVLHLECPHQQPECPGADQKATCQLQLNLFVCKAGDTITKMITILKERRKEQEARHLAHCPHSRSPTLPPPPLPLHRQHLHDIVPTAQNFPLPRQPRLHEFHALPRQSRQFAAVSGPEVLHDQEPIGLWPRGIAWVLTAADEHEHHEDEVDDSAIET